jgi:hypothetical protein
MDSKCILGFEPIHGGAKRVEEKYYSSYIIPRVA